MADIILGILAIIAGVVMLLAGQFVLRLLLPIWGFFAGFAFGAGLVADFADERFLGTVLGWILGFVFAIVFARPRLPLLLRRRHPGDGRVRVRDRLRAWWSLSASTGTGSPY